MSGVYVIARAAWDHPLFKPERFTEREAWMWLISSCVWKPKRIRVGNSVVSLVRGQCAFSLRFMATKWRWSEPKVRRFLNKLKTDAMVLVDTTQQVTQITVCNYDKYQFGRRSDVAESDALNDAAATQHRRKEEELNNLRTDDDGGERGRVVSDACFEIAREIGKICGFDEPLDWPLSWAQGHMRVQTWLNAGWPREMILAACQDAMARKRDGPPFSMNYFDKPIASFIAKQATPLPQVKIIERETINVTRNDEGGSVLAAQRRLIAGAVNFGPRPSLTGSGAGVDHVRLLPEGGCEFAGDVHSCSDGDIG